MIRSEGGEDYFALSASEKDAKECLCIIGNINNRVAAAARHHHALPKRTGTSSSTLCMSI
jgi:hypothetical protein